MLGKYEELCVTSLYWCGWLEPYYTHKMHSGMHVFTVEGKQLCETLVKNVCFSLGYLGEGN